MTNWAQIERAKLCDLFVDVGPDAPTLCGEWTARDLAAHLVVRERRPDAAAGIVISLPLLSKWTAKVQQQFADQEWTSLIDAVRSGPPVWSPTRIEMVDKQVNTTEFFIHHEDVRRAADRWEPRVLDAAQEAALGKALKMSKLLMRRSPCGVVLHPNAGDAVVARAGEPHVDISGPASELLLFAFGRQAHAMVELSGDAAQIAHVREAAFGL